MLCGCAEWASLKCLYIKQEAVYVGNPQCGYICTIKFHFLYGMECLFLMYALLTIITACAYVFKKKASKMFIIVHFHDILYTNPAVVMLVHVKCIIAAT